MQGDVNLFGLFDLCAQKRFIKTRKPRPQRCRMFIKTT